MNFKEEIEIFYKYSATVCRVAGRCFLPMCGDVAWKIIYKYMRRCRGICRPVALPTSCDGCAKL